MSVKVTGLKETEKEIQAFAVREMNDFIITLQPIIFNRSPMGPSEGITAGIKRSWRWEKVRKKGDSLQGGLINDLPYVEKINTEKLRHLAGMKDAKKWERSFGTELGKPRAAWAQRIYGTDTKQRRYGRGYRRAVEQGRTDTFATNFIETSVKEAGGKVMDKTTGAEAVYFIDITMKF